MGRPTVSTLAIWLVAASASGQTLIPPDQPSLLTTTRSNLFAKDGDTFAKEVGAQPAPNRPCDGCPERRVGRALIQATFINVFYGLGNLVRGEETAKVTPKTWWANMRHGWEWDLNDFTVNQFGHPYQGNNYFTAGRANGLSYWESSAVTAFGSATWEFFGETNDASLNDFVNTTLGGIALGEMFHRTAWLIRDTKATGKGRLWKEIFATAVDPLTGYNRFVSGDASRVTEKPPDMVPDSLGTVGQVGVLWHGNENGGFEDAAADPFVEVDLLYGNMRSTTNDKPFDAFYVRLNFGGGQALSEARVRGRLIGKSYHDGGLQMMVTQEFLYNNNDAYQFGAQAFDLLFSYERRLSTSVTMWVNGWGGVTVLGAADSVPLATLEGLEEEVTASSSEEEPTERDYDYGPGTNAGASLIFLHGRRAFSTTSYDLHHIHVIDGIRANHLLQRLRTDLDVPIRGRLGAGVTFDYFSRHTFYQQDVTAHTTFPQLRAFLSWSWQ